MCISPDFVNQSRICITLCDIKRTFEKYKGWVEVQQAGRSIISLNEGALCILTNTEYFVGYVLLFHHYDNFGPRKVSSTTYTYRLL